MLQTVKPSVIFSHFILLFLLAGCGGSGGGGTSSGNTGNSTTVGDVTLTWNAPTTYANNSTLNPATNLQAYNIYYGTESEVYTKVVSVVNPGTSIINYTLNLPKGNSYYFVVTDIDTSGNESGPSNEVIKTP